MKIKLYYFIHVCIFDVRAEVHVAVYIRKVPNFL